jgi:signal transduction histidine kinase
MSVGYATLSELVRGKRPQILSAWDEEVRRLAPHAPPSAISSRGIAAVLDHIADVAERIADGEVQLSQEVPRQHARERAGEGSELADVVRDFAALRSAILRCSREDVAAGDGKGAVAERKRDTERWVSLDRAIDEAVIACVAYYDEQRERTPRWLDRLTNALLESKTLDDACQQLLCVLNQAVPLADVGAAFLRDGDYLRPRACVGPDMDLARLSVVSLDEALVWSTATPHEARAVPAVHAAPLLRHEPIDRDAIDALLYLPLHSAGELLGVVYLGSQRTTEFPADDVRLATALARRAAAALSQPMATERARQAVRARDEVLGMVSHDLGNPLGAILIAASSLLGGGASAPELDPDVKKSLQAIQRSATRMRRLLQDLVDFVRSDSAPLSLRVAPHKPAALAQEVVEGLTMDARKRGIALRVDVPSDLPAVLCDRERTLQVLWNVVGNALHTTAAGGSVGVRAAARPQEVLFSVSDTGAGIAHEDLQHVFDRYRRNGEGRSNAGIGLAVARSIVDAHQGGRIWAESEPGAGNKILFTLPLAP